MQKINFRNFFCLSRKKISLTIFFIFIAHFYLLAQPTIQRKSAKSSYNPQFKNYTSSSERDNEFTKKFSYGFFLGVGTHRFFDQNSTYSTDSAAVIIVNPTYSLGFSLGFVANYSLTSRLDLRILPQVSFYERAVNYKIKTNATDTSFRNVNKSIESTFIEIPILIKYKSLFRGKDGQRNAFVTAGFKPGFSVSSQKEANANLLRTGTIDLALEYGFGFDFKFKFFKFSPEIRFSHGLLNLLVSDKSIYSRSLTRLNSNSITLYLNFN